MSASFHLLLFMTFILFSDLVIILWSHYSLGLESAFRSWRCGSMVKNTYCSLRRPRSKSWHPYGRQLTTLCNSISIISDASFYAPGILDTSVHIHIHIAHNIKLASSLFEGLAGEHSHSYALDQRRVLLCSGKVVLFNRASGGAHMEQWRENGTPA